MDNPAGEALGAALPKQGGIKRHFKGAALWGGGRGDPDGATIRGSRGRQARLRVSGPDGVPVGGDARSAVGGDRPGGCYVGRFRRNG